MRLPGLKFFFALCVAILSPKFIVSAAKAQSADTNLLLITIDTLRPDRLSCYSQKYVQTPAIDAQAAKGVLFEKAFAHTPITLPSHANILLGTTPLYHGVSENSKTRVANAFLTLAEHLKSNGYATGAFVGAFPLDSRFGLDQGFDVYDDSLPSKSESGFFFAERKAEDVIAPALAWLSNQKGKWFCWIHVWDPHAPYRPPEPFLSRYINDPYSGEVAYVDSQIGRLMSELHKKGWLDRTLVVVTADHGESLGEHGELTHSYFAYNSTLHVPLIMAGPGIRHSRLDEPVSHIDIFPTVCELLNIKAPPFLQGESLAPRIHGKKGTARAIYFESLDPYLNKGCAPLRGFMEGQRKYIDCPIPEVYDLAKDFDESANLAVSLDLSPLRKKLQEMEKSLSLPMNKEGSQVADRQALDKLRSLGYVSSPVAQVKEKYGPEDDLKSFLPFQQKLERAILLGDQGKPQESIELMIGLIRDRKDFGPAYVYLSQTYLTQGRMPAALRVLEEGVGDNPKDYTLISSWATLLVKAGLYDRAAEALQKALSILDFDPVVWDNLGIISWRKGDYQKALEYYQKAISLDKTFALAFSNLGQLYLSLYTDRGNKPEDLVRAIDHFRKAVVLDPTLNLAFRALGVAYQTAGKVDEAIAAWEKAVETKPNDDFSALNLGQAYLEKGNKAGALKCFQRYLELKKDKLSPEERNGILALIEKCK
jgi:arylsulfatase A-like enzyme/Flp pilus assembly protein TadD